MSWGHRSVGKTFLAMNLSTIQNDKNKVRFVKSLDKNTLELLSGIQKSSCRQ